MASFRNRWISYLLLGGWSLLQGQGKRSQRSPWHRAGQSHTVGEGPEGMSLRGQFLLPSHPWVNLSFPGKREEGGRGRAWGHVLGQKHPGGKRVLG